MNWVPEEQYKLICESVPIACVDLLPLRRTEAGLELGLIQRTTYDGGLGWCLVGGAVQLDETLHEALIRHVTTSLGAQAAESLTGLTFSHVQEYVRAAHVDVPHDPRKHAIAMSYWGEIDAEIVPAGEAHDFRWLQREDLPGVDFGFGQEHVVAAILRGGVE